MAAVSEHWSATDRGRVQKIFRALPLTSSIWQRFNLRKRLVTQFAPPNKKLRCDYILIITYGRSGSTLLQGLLNSIEGVLVRGENNNFIQKLYHAYQSLSETAGENPTVPENPWYGLEKIDIESFRSTLRDAIISSVFRPDSEHHVLGFKEIRYTPQEMDDAEFESYLDFLQMLFPGAALIFNTRNLADVVRSGWWPQVPNAMELLQATNERFTKYLSLQKGNCIHVHYDDYVADPSKLEPLFDFLGAPFDLNRISTVLGKRHSY